MAIARVQSKVADTAATNAATLVITLGAATTSGNILMVAIGTTGLPLKVTSTHGNFYCVTPQAFDATGSATTTSIFLGIMTGADTAITVATATGGTAPISAIAVEYSGVKVTPDNIPSIASGAASSSNVVTGALANTNANALYVGAITAKVNSSTENSTWASGNAAPFNLVGQTSTNVNSGTVDKALVYLDAIVSSSSSRTANVVIGWGTSNRYAGVLASFYESGGGGLRLAGHGGLAA